ncbi:MAG: hypothetical protein QNL33_06485 [Akkermansiaceae bacterium]
MMKRNLFTSVVVYFLLLGVSRGQGLWDEAFAILEADDVTVAGDDPVRLQVWYYHPSGILRETGGDSDLWVTSVEGFHSGVTFGEWLPLRRLGDTATYELAAPEGGWRVEHNGEYAVMLASDEISVSEGESFPLTLTGSFQVQIDDEKRIIPAMVGGISFERFPTPGVPSGEVQELIVANLTATFPFPVEVNWGELKRGADGGFSVSVDACEIDGIVPQVVTSYRHSLELGTLGAGSYTLVLNSGGKLIARESVAIMGDDFPVEGTPHEVSIEIKELPTLGVYPAFSAKVRLRYGGFVERSEWGTVRRKRNLLSSEMTAWINPAIATFAPTVIENEVFLGMLEPGEYRYSLSSLGNVVGSVSFTVPGVDGGDRTAPSVKVHGAKVSEPGPEPLVFTVEFSDPSELVVSGIEAQRLTAMNRLGEVFEIERTDLAVTADHAVSAIATYQMEAPGGSWGEEDRGRYRLLLSDPELLADREGNHLLSPLIGYLTVEILPDDPEPVHTTELTVREDELIGRWTASVRLFVPEDLAVRDDWSVAWGEVRPVGPSFYLRPRFVRAGSNEEIRLVPPSNTTGAGMWVEHDYDLGPISSGRWVVCLESNLGHFAKGLVNAGASEMEPFDFWKDRLNPVDGLINEREFWEYCVGTDPLTDSDDREGDPRAELVDGAEGIQHLGLRCRMAVAAVDARLRFQGSRDMKTWVDLGPDEIEEVERVSKEGGIEEFMVCLKEGLGQGEFRYLRAIAERW